MTANQSPVIWVDGVQGERLSPLDRGLAYGDGLFETCRVIDGCIPLWSWHRARMLKGLARLGMDMGGSRLDESVRQALSCAGADAGILKLMVTRQARSRGYQAAGNPHLSTTVIFFPDSSAAPAGPDAYRVRLCRTPVSINRALAGMKHLCRLENVLARSEWSCADIHEGLLQDLTGHIIEATAHNLFTVHAGELVTPDLSEAGVCGVMRQLILDDLAPSLAIPVRQAPVSLADICVADELFLCNSCQGIVPVTELLDAEEQRVAQFAVGPVTQRLQNTLVQYWTRQSQLSDMRRC